MSWVKNSRKSTEPTYRRVVRHARTTAPRSKVRGCLGTKGAIGTVHTLKWAGQWARVDRSPSDNHTRKLASYSWTKGAASSESDGFPAFLALPAQLHLQNSTGRSPILALFSVMYRPNGSSYPQKQHRTLANFFERFFGHVPTARLKLPLKTAQDARHFLLALFSVMYRSNGSFYP